MKWRAFCAGAVALCIAALLMYRGTTHSYSAALGVPTALTPKIIEINGHTIDVEVVDTPAAREKGLGGRNSLAEDHGMLFIFQKDGEYAFWMKDMRFSIDIVWISAAGSVVGMSEHVSPSTYPTTFSPRVPARYVLELPGDAVKRYNLHFGDIVRL